jgi:hypothetical protein
VAFQQVLKAVTKAAENACKLCAPRVNPGLPVPCPVLRDCAGIIPSQIGEAGAPIQAHAGLAAVAHISDRPLQLGSRFDELARHLFEPRNYLGLRGCLARAYQRNLLDTGIAIALQIIGLDRIGVGRHR